MYIFQPDRHLLASFIAAKAPLMRGHVLDVGGQDGRRYRDLFTNAQKYTTHDVDALLKPDIVAPVEHIPLPDVSIDGVLCAEVLMDVYRPEEAIAEIARILRPGGVLILTVSFMCALYNEPNNYWRFTPFVLDRMLRVHFKEVSIERRGGYWSLRAQQWIRYRIERYRLYDRHFLGAFYSLLSSLMGRLAIARDVRDHSSANQKFALGYNVVAVK